MVSANIPVPETAEAAQQDPTGGLLVRVLLESCPAVGYIKDMQGRYRVLNEAAASFAAQFGLTTSQIIGRTDEEVFPKDVAEVFSAADWQVIREQRPLQVEEHGILDARGRGNWRLSIRFPLRDSAGRMQGVCGLCVDITRQKEAELRETERATLSERHSRELERANADLRDFAHVAAHDLKEPLRGMRLLIGMLREDAADRLTFDDRTRLESVDRLALRMHDLLDAMLRYSRLGRARLRMVHTDLSAVVAEVVHDLRAALAERNARVELPVEGLPSVDCDPELVAQVFSNLILNAIRYNDSAEPVVRVSGALFGGSPVIRVSDNGIGIAPEHFGLIFQMFRRVTARRGGSAGTGAGLAITKRIVESHGGQIWLESEPGQGSTFYFTLAPHMLRDGCV